MSKPLRIGLLGSGFAAHFHLASYRKVYGERFEIASLCTLDDAAGRQLAETYAIPEVHGDLQRMLDDPTIDAIDVCVPNHLHMDVALKAAERGKHVICEKPLGGFFGPPGAGKDWSAKGYSREEMLLAVVERAKAVEAAVAKAGVVFCYGENWVYAPPIVKLARLMAASDSTIMRVQGEESHSGSHGGYAKRWRTAGGGSLLRLCVHPLGAALHLKYEEGRRRTGRPIRPVSVTAEVRTLTEIAAFKAEEPKHMGIGWDDVEDFGAMIVTFEDGSVAQVSSTDTKMGGINNYLTAYGSRAVVTANINPNNTCQAYTPDGRYFANEYIVEKTETKEGWSYPAPDEDSVTGYPEELRDFVGSMTAGRQPRSDFMLAYDVLVTVYAAYLAAERGERVDLRPYLG